MPIPEDKKSKYKVIIASLRKKFRKSGMKKSESNALSKEKTESALGIK
jgi:hypothetical protein